MVVALFVVAFAMIVAGGAAIYDGSAIVLMEKGWTKVISGTVGASAGFVLVGIACLLLELKRLGASLPERAVLPGPLPESLPESLSGPLPLPLRPPAAEAPPVAAALPAEGEETPAARPSQTLRDAAPAVAAAPAPLADGGPPISPAPPPAPAEPERASEPVEPRDVVHAPEAAPSHGTPREDPATIVVGTYASGGNTYVMYADGSIQADTPTGLYRFDSLDELKAFIAAGGESGGPPPNAGRRS